ncbi:MAG: hypothetical protein WDM80_09465 [Limisphaerales bacterium]
MSLNERIEMKAALHKVSADLGALFLQCQAARALHLGVSVRAAQTNINEALRDVEPDAPDYYVPPPLEMATPKF